MSQALLLDPISLAENREREEQIERHIRVAGWFVEALKELDSDLELHLAKPNAAPPFKAGYWHVVKQNKGIVSSVIPIVGRRGEFCEPSPYHLEELKNRDMRDKRIYEDTLGLYEREQKEKAKAAAEQRAEINDDARIMYNAKRKREIRGKKF